MIDRKFKAVEEEKRQYRQDKKDRLVLEQEEREAEFDYFDELHRGIVKMKEAGFDFWNGYEQSYFDKYVAVQEKIKSHNNKQLAAMQAMQDKKV